MAPKAAGSSNFFTENNPFKTDEPEESFQSQGDATIHKVYNQWIALLQERIDLELGLISPDKSPATHYSQRNANKKVECDDMPLTELSGSASSRDAHVNLRSGASTRCKIVGSVSQADSFKLLGQKGNWYFVALDRGDQAWIYAPLVHDGFHSHIMNSLLRFVSLDSFHVGYGGDFRLISYWRRLGRDQSSEFLYDGSNDHLDLRRSFKSRSGTAA